MHLFPILKPQTPSLPSLILTILTSFISLIYKIWKQQNKQEAMIQLTAFKAKYGKRYPEAVRSLAEEE